MTTTTVGISAHYFIGAIPEFDAPHLRVDAFLPMSIGEWGDLQLWTVQAARQIAHAFRGAPIVARAVDLLGRAGKDADPLSAWIRALERAHGAPSSLIQSTLDQDGRLTIRWALPYPEPAERWARFGFELLELGSRLKAERTIDLDGESWRNRIAALGEGLPDPREMAMHAELTRRRRPWRWAGPKRTVIGFGARQQVIKGAGDVGMLTRILDGVEADIPIYTVTGSIGKTTTVRLLGQLLAASGRRLGMTTSDGMWIGDEQIAEGDSLGGRAALRILTDSKVELALLELGRGGITRPGIPFPRSDVAILLNVRPMHLGLRGIDTVEQMADVKGLSLARAALAILNDDDEQCRRIGGKRDPASCVWFSTTGTPKGLRARSAAAAGVVGVKRNPQKKPVAITLWRSGALEAELPLEGVRPYHGFLGEKTLEELCAAVGAAYFGPVDVGDLAELLPTLALNSANHRFRTSLHRRGNLFFLLDKGSTRDALQHVGPIMQEICEEHKIGRRIAALVRSALRPPESLPETVQTIYDWVDEFICIDAPASYSHPEALPDYSFGEVSRRVAAEVERLNKERKLGKPAVLADDWEAAERLLDEMLADVAEPTLVLVNQPSTASVAVLNQIERFVTHGRTQDSAKEEDVEEDEGRREAIAAMRSQLAELLARPDSLFFTKRPPDQKRGIDFYTATSLLTVVVDAALVYRKAHGRFPNIVAPRGFTEKIFWSKFFAKMKVPEAGNKLHTDSFIPARLRGEVTVPEIVWRSRQARLPADHAIPPGLYYLKANHGCNMFSEVEWPPSPARRDALEREFSTYLQTPYGMHSGEWWYNAFEREIHLERSVAPSPSVAWCYFTFRGEVALISVYRKTDEGPESTLLDPDFTLFEFQNPKRPRTVYVEPSSDAKQRMLAAAREIGATLPFARIDFLLGDGERIFLSEITFSPGNALTVWPDRINERLGDLWILDD